MSYTPTSWQNGDVITSAKLNKIENGIANAGGGTNILFATIDTSTMALDKTWQELVNADVAYILASGTSEGHRHLPIIHMEAVQNDAYYVVALGVAKVTGGTVDVSFELTPFTFKATSADGYPMFVM